MFRNRKRLLKNVGGWFSTKKLRGHRHGGFLDTKTIEKWTFKEFLQYNAIILVLALLVLQLCSSSSTTSNLNVFGIVFKNLQRKSRYFWKRFNGESTLSSTTDLSDPEERIIIGDIDNKRRTEVETTEVETTEVFEIEDEYIPESRFEQVLKRWERINLVNKIRREFEEHLLETTRNLSRNLSEEEREELVLLHDNNSNQEDVNFFDVDLNRKLKEDASNNGGGLNQYTMTALRCDARDEIKTSQECDAAFETIFGKKMFQHISEPMKVHTTREAVKALHGKMPTTSGCYWNQRSWTRHYSSFHDPRDKSANYGHFLTVCRIHHASTHESPAYLPCLYIGCVLLISFFCQGILAKTPVAAVIPHSVTLFCSGALLALCFESSKTDLGRAITDVEYIDAHIVFMIMLPALLYEDSSGADWHVCRRVLSNSILLAIPGVLLNTLLTGYGIVLSFPAPFGYSEWPIWSSLTLGTILSATDPVAVIGALNALKAPAKLTLLIAGESLLNDGSAFVFFMVFFDTARGVKEFSLTDTILRFCRLAFGGPALAILAMIPAGYIFRHTSERKVVWVVTLFIVYGLFFIAEMHAVHVSGVLAVVCFGFYMSSTGKRKLISQGGEELHHCCHIVIEFIALLSNELIFVTAGVIGYRYSVTYNLELKDWLALGWLYILIHITRGIVIGIFFPFLRRSGYGLTFLEAVVLTLSGLRGAVGIAMAILVESDASAHPLDIELRVRVAFYVSGITVLTLFINGVMITPIYRKLNLYQHSPLQVSFLSRMLTKCQEEYESHLTHHMSKHWFFQNIDFDILNEALPNLETLLENPEDTLLVQATHFKDLFKRQEANTIAAFDMVFKKKVDTLEEILEKRHSGDFSIKKLKVLFFEELFQSGKIAQEWWQPRKKIATRKIDAEHFGGGMEFFIHKAGGAHHNSGMGIEHEMDGKPSLKQTLETREEIRLEQSLHHGSDAPGMVPGIGQDDDDVYNDSKKVDGNFPGRGDAKGAQVRGSKGWSSKGIDGGDGIKGGVEPLVMTLDRNEVEANATETIPHVIDPDEAGNWSLHDAGNWEHPTANAKTNLNAVRFDVAEEMKTGGPKKLNRMATGFAKNTGLETSEVHFEDATNARDSAISTQNPKILNRKQTGIATSGLTAVQFDSTVVGADAPKTLKRNLTGFVKNSDVQTGEVLFDSQRVSSNAGSNEKPLGDSATRGDSANLSGVGSQGDSQGVRFASSTAGDSAQPIVREQTGFLQMEDSKNVHWDNVAGRGASQVVTSNPKILGRTQTGFIRTEMTNRNRVDLTGRWQRDDDEYRPGENEPEDEQYDHNTDPAIPELIALQAQMGENRGQSGGSDGYLGNSGQSDTLGQPQQGYLEISAGQSNPSLNLSSNRSHQTIKQSIPKSPGGQVQMPQEMIPHPSYGKQFMKGHKAEILERSQFVAAAKGHPSEKGHPNEKMEKNHPSMIEKGQKSLMEKGQMIEKRQKGMIMDKNRMMDERMMTQKGVIQLSKEQKPGFNPQEGMHKQGIYQDGAHKQGVYQDGVGHQSSMRDALVSSKGGAARDKLTASTREQPAVSKADEATASRRDVRTDGPSTIVWDEHVTSDEQHNSHDATHVKITHRVVVCSEPIQDDVSEFTYSEAGKGVKPSESESSKHTTYTKWDHAWVQGENNCNDQENVGRDEQEHAQWSENHQDWKRNHQDWNQNHQDWNQNDQDWNQNHEKVWNETEKGWYDAQETHLKRYQSDHKMHANAWNESQNDWQGQEDYNWNEGAHSMTALSTPTASIARTTPAASSSNQDATTYFGGSHRTSLCGTMRRQRSGVARTPTTSSIARGIASRARGRADSPFEGRHSMTDGKHPVGEVGCEAKPEIKSNLMKKKNEAKQQHMKDIRVSVYQDHTTNKAIMGSLCDAILCGFRMIQMEKSFHSGASVAILLESCAYMNDAINGELSKNCEFLHDCQVFFPEMPDPIWRASAEVQAEWALNVQFLYIYDSVINRHCHSLRHALIHHCPRRVSRFFYGLSQIRVRTCYKQFETILFYMIVLESVKETIPGVKNAPDIFKNCNNMLRLTKNVVLHNQLFCKSPELFYLWMHLLTAKMCVSNMILVLEEFVEEGLLAESDKETVSEVVMKRCLDAFEKFYNLDQSHFRTTGSVIAYVEKDKRDILEILEQERKQDIAAREKNRLEEELNAELEQIKATAEEEEAGNSDAGEAWYNSGDGAWADHHDDGDENGDDQKLDGVFGNQKNRYTRYTEDVVDQNSANSQAENGSNRAKSGYNWERQSQQPRPLQQDRLTMSIESCPSGDEPNKRPSSAVKEQHMNLMLESSKNKNKGRDMNIMKEIDGKGNKNLTVEFESKGRSGYNMQKGNNMAESHKGKGKLGGGLFIGGNAKGGVGDKGAGNSNQFGAGTSTGNTVQFGTRPSQEVEFDTTPAVGSAHREFSWDEYSSEQSQQQNWSGNQQTQQQNWNHQPHEQNLSGNQQTQQQNWNHQPNEQNLSGNQQTQQQSWNQQPHEQNLSGNQQIQQQNWNQQPHGQNWSGNQQQPEQQHWDQQQPEQEHWNEKQVAEQYWNEKKPAERHWNEKQPEQLNIAAPQPQHHSRLVSEFQHKISAIHHAEEAAISPETVEERHPSLKQVRHLHHFGDVNSVGEEGLKGKKGSGLVGMLSEQKKHSGVGSHEGTSSTDSYEVPAPALDGLTLPVSGGALALSALPTPGSGYQQTGATAQHQGAIPVQYQQQAVSAQQQWSNEPQQQWSNEPPQHWGNQVDYQQQQQQSHQQMIPTIPHPHSNNMRK